MRRSRSARLVLVLVAAAIVYHWLGAASFAIGLLVFMLYELLVPPPRYRKFGPGEIQQAVDNRFGQFGWNYREDEPDPARLRVGRNDPCPCGSGLKFKRFCGRLAE